MMLIDLEINDNIAIIRLNRPNFKNALNLELINALCDILNDLKFKKKDIYKDIRVILLTGNGDSFCSGGDIKNMKSNTGMFSGESNELRENYENGIQQIPLIIESIQIPIIALVNGAAIGAGCDLACMCDIRLGSISAKFGETFAKLNLVPGDGGTYFLQRIIGYAKAMELFLTCEVIDSKKALAIGLINNIYDDDQLLIEGLKLAKKIASNGPSAIKLTKKSLKFSRVHSLSDSLSMLATDQSVCQRMSDHQEGLEALLLKRKANFKNV